MDNAWLIRMGYGAQHPADVALPIPSDYEKADFILGMLGHYCGQRTITPGTTAARDREAVARALAAERMGCGQ